MMNVLFERCAGLDVHKQSVVACRMLTTSNSGASTHSDTRSFGTTVSELLCCASVTG